uniref:NADH-ubiquinone oxidoreductase chain 2 n=1 Tax=Perna perna TaxID=94826 RepID=A0A0B4U181_PERPR|nr:NADH dehydrogenase subunit 2 [Perna perna]AJC00162.1 NADH dehydrogenase subunit 2 [Perna perna]
MLLMSSILVLFGTLMSVSSSSWVGVWLGMEINLLNFMVLMNPDGTFVVEPSAKYFVVQGIGSNFVLSGFLLSEVFHSVISSIFLVIGFMLKSGVCPFHSWLPSVVSSSSWFPAMMVLTWQKLSPFVFMGWFIGDFLVILSTVLLALVGGIGGLNQHSVRSLLAYSSFVHSSWMVLALLESFWIFIIYWVVYSLSVGMVFWSCGSSGKVHLKSKGRLIWVSFGVFMLMGLPPFLGFTCKILVFLSVHSYVIFICVIGSVISMKYYLTLAYSLILGSPIFGHWYKTLRSTVIIFFNISLNLVGFLAMTIFLFL